MKDLQNFDESGKPIQKMGDEGWKKYFDGLLSFQKITINIAGGIALTLYNVLLEKETSSQVEKFHAHPMTLTVSFIIGYILINYQVKEVRRISFKDVIRFVIPLAFFYTITMVFFGYN